MKIEKAVDKATKTQITVDIFIAYIALQTEDEVEETCTRIPVYKALKQGANIPELSLFRYEVEL
jgi:hypothetical protein